MKRLLVIVGLCLGLVGAQTVAARAAGPRTAGELVIGINQVPPGLHPMIDPATAKTYLQYLALRRLTVYDPDRRVVCQLCVEVPTLANGQARLTDRPGGGRGMDVTYRLRDDVFWGDGTPVTANDIVFSWQAGRRPDMGFQNPDVFAGIEGVEVLDPKRVVVHLNRLQANYNVLDWAILPAHVEGPVLAGLKDVTDYRKASGYARAPTTPGLWNGPYVLSAVQSGSSYLYDLNPHWKGPKPAFKRVIVRVIENTAALEANLLSGDIDYIAGEIGVSIDQGLSLERRAADRFDFAYVPSLTFEHLDVKLDNPILKDALVRRALLLAVDREQINARVFGGKQRVAHSWLNTKEPGYNPGVKAYPYDPAQAGRLLSEAGWTPGPGGIRVNAAGKRLQIELMTTAGNKQRELVQAVLQSQWRQVGIEALIRNEPARTLFGLTLKQRLFNGLALYAWSSSPEEPPIQILSSTMIPTAENNYAGSNYGGYSNPEFDTLIATVRGELDEAKRRALWYRMQDIYAEDLPALPMFFRSDTFIIPKWLKGMRPTGHLVPSTAWVEEWHVAP